MIHTSIILTTTGRKDMACACLKRVLETAGHLPIEIVCAIDVDRESQKALGEILEQWQNKHPDFRYRIVFSEVYLGSAAATNNGLKYTTGEYIVTVGDDTYVEDGWLDEAIRIMQENFPDGIGAIGADDGHQKDGVICTTPILTREFIKRYLGGCFLTPHYKKWYGDIEFTARAKRSGRYVYAPSVKLTHRCPESGYRQRDETDMRFWNEIPNDEALFGKRAEAGFPDDFPASI